MNKKETENLFPFYSLRGVTGSGLGNKEGVSAAAAAVSVAP